MPAQALYLKWRPQTFEDVIGQEHITRTLRNALRQGRTRHAYLFSGPRGTGKTTMARLLAKALNCLEADLDRRPCNVCANCVAVNEGRFLDLIEIDAASHTGVDDVRDLRDKIAFSPGEGRFKVYIIDEVHRFSGAAFDALLKTLEEPPAHAVFVLATTEIAKVPATIKSRCLMFEFRRVSLAEVADRLALIAQTEDVSIDRAALELIAREGTGSVRDSISLLDQLLADPSEHLTLDMTEQMLGTASSQQVVDLAHALLDNNAAWGLDLINAAVDRGADPRQFGRQVVDYLRQLLLVKMAGDALIDASQERRAVLHEQAAATSRAALLGAIRAFNAALQDWQQGGWQPQLPLELAFLEGIKPGAEEEPVPAPEPRPAAAHVESPAAPPVVEAAPAAPEGEPVRIKDLRDQWAQVQKAAKGHTPLLPPLLEHATPREIKGDVLVLGVENDTFKQKLSAPDKRTILEAVLLELFGVALKVRIEVSGAHSQASEDVLAEDDVLAFGVNDLGGELSEYDG